MEYINISNNQILEKLNAEKAFEATGGICFVSGLMVFGVVGNMHVLVVFARKIRSSNHKTFICCLGVIDMIACTLSMPSNIIDLTHPLTFYYSVVCKIVRTINYFMCISSALILVIVTLDRYRKLCHPMGWQLTNRMAKRVCCLTILFSFGCSLPAFFIFGHRTVETGYQNLTGVQCSTNDDYIATNFPTIYNVILIVLAVIMVAAFVVMYALISHVILNHWKGTTREMLYRSDQRKRDFAESAFSISVADISVDTFESPDCFSDARKKVSEGSHKNCSSYRMNNISFAENSINVKNRAALIKETRRKTFMFFVIVAIFFLSYLPNLFIKLITYTNYEIFQHLTLTGATIYNIFTWFFYVNNVANPVVYFFLDVRFRKEIKTFYRRLWPGKFESC